MTAPRTPDPDFSELTEDLAESLRDLSDAWANLTPAEQEEFAKRLDDRLSPEVKSDAS